MKRILIVAAAVCAFAIGCVSQPDWNLSAKNSFGVPAYEYACGTREKEDKFLEGDADRWEAVVKNNPQLLTNLSRVIEYANDIRSNCRPDEVPLVDAALEECGLVIPSGTEEERINAFKKLHEFHRRCLLRIAWQAAKEAAKEAAGFK